MKIRELLRFLSDYPWYPLLIAVLPVARFYEANYPSFYVSDYLRLVAIYLVLAGLMLTLSGVIWRSRQRGALVAAPLVAVLFGGNDLGGWWSLGMMVIAVGLGVFLALRRPNPAPATLPLNATFLVLLMLPLLTAWWSDRSAQAPVPTALFAQPLPVQAPAGAIKPDIWFLLVDGLGNPAFVEQEFKLNAAAYSGQLRRRGFQIPEASFANYQQTGLSVSATWNVAHIPLLLDVPDTASQDRRVLYDLISNSRVLRTLEGLGYRTVNLPSSYPMTRLRQADVWREPFLAPNMVEFSLLEKSVLPLVHRLFGRGPSDLSFALRRRNLRYIFEHLPEARATVSADKPALIFSHILAPHPPFVFDTTGGALHSEKAFGFVDGSHWLDLHGWAAGHYPEKYRAQAIFVMARLGEVVDRILAQATRPTVIIIQGDHGPGSRLDWERPGHTDHLERSGIFNAWYLPPGMTADLPEGVTALETFPMLFKTLFGAEVPVASDGFMISRWSRPYIFYQVRQ